MAVCYLLLITVAGCAPNNDDEAIAIGDIQEYAFANFAEYIDSQDVFEHTITKKSTEMRAGNKHDFIVTYEVEIKEAQDSPPERMVYSLKLYRDENKEITLTSRTINGQKDLQSEMLLFEGESENWIGVIVQVFTETWELDEDKVTSYENNSQEKYELRYIGDDPASVGTVKFAISGGSHTLEGEAQLVNNVLISATAEGTGTSAEWNNAIFSVTIKWDNETETFEMVSSDR